MTTTGDRAAIVASHPTARIFVPTSRSEVHELHGELQKLVDSDVPMYVAQKVLLAVALVARLRVLASALAALLVMQRCTSSCSPLPFPGVSG